MRKKRILLPALLTAFMVSNQLMSPRRTATAQEATAAPKPSPTAINVTTTIYDSDATGAQLLLRSDDFNGTGQATYTTFKGKGANAAAVTSQITPDGQWYLSMNDQSGRSVWITPNQSIDSGQPTAPPAGYYVIQKVYSVCRDQNENAVPYPNLVNGSNDCSLAVNFFYSGTLYKLLMRPGALDGTLCPPGGCPPTGMAKVTCNAVSNNQCVNWTITPNTNAPLVGVANLYSYTGPRGAEWVFIGQYYNTFCIHATNP